MSDDDEPAAIKLFCTLIKVFEIEIKWIKLGWRVRFLTIKILNLSFIS
jgi:hypothetical protein